MHYRQGRQVVIGANTAHFNPRGRKPLLWAGEPDDADYAVLEKLGSGGSDLAFRRCSERELRSLFDLVERIARTQIDQEGKRRPTNFLMFSKFVEVAIAARQFWTEETITAIAAHHWDWLEWGIVYVIRTASGDVKVGRTKTTGFFKRLERHRRDFGPDVDLLFFGLSPMHAYAERVVHDCLKEYRIGSSEIFRVAPNVAVTTAKAVTRFGIDGATIKSESDLDTAINERRRGFSKVFRRVVELIDPCSRLAVFDPLESSKEAVALIKAIDRLWSEASKERQVHPRILTDSQG